jgi:hypothetical protein
MKRLLYLPLTLLFLTTLACQAILPDSRVNSGEFEGFYTSGFEVASFIPGEMIGDPNQGVGYWVNGTPELYEQYTALVQSRGSDPISGYIPVYVRFKGELSPPGNYGHLGAYEREVTVTELLEMSLDGECQNN